ncbi:MAG: hypothetical protein BRC58_10070 [Cyanobacteria bacterium QS_8_64_29]|nr:MAG: hypothetical protein BRC58_10070 [Cyanobacteria bacterium QS_8_64_29]
MHPLLKLVLLGTDQAYRVAGVGGRPEKLTPWVSELAWQGERWHGWLVGDPDAFAAELARMGARLEHLERARPSLEAFFFATDARARDRSRALDTSVLAVPLPRMGNNGL